MRHPDYPWAPSDEERLAFYDEIQRMSCELAADFAMPGTNLYDLGCATGTTLLQLEPFQRAM